MIAVALGLSAVTIALGSAETPVWLSIVTWLLSLCALIGLGLTLDRLSVREAVKAVRSLLGGEHGTEVGSVLVIAGVALVLRFFDLEVVPAFFHEDEGEMAQIALNIVSGTRVPFFKTAAEWGPTYPFNYMEAFWIWLFGSTAASARTVSALAGVLCVPVVYVIGRLGLGADRRGDRGVAPRGQPPAHPLQPARPGVHGRDAAGCAHDDVPGPRGRPGEAGRRANAGTTWRRGRVGGGPVSGRS